MYTINSYFYPFFYSFFFKIYIGYGSHFRFPSKFTTQTEKTVKSKSSCPFEPSRVYVLSDRLNHERNGYHSDPKHGYCEFLGNFYRGPIQ